MSEDAVTRAIRSAAREAFRLGKAAAADRGQAAKFQEQAVTYAEDLVLPMVGHAIQEAIEQRWIADHPAASAADHPAAPAAASGTP